MFLADFNYLIQLTNTATVANKNYSACFVVDFLLYISWIKTEILIYGMGAAGVLLYSNKLDTYVLYKPVKTNEIVNTVGAGNALFSCFLHYYNQTGDSTFSIRNALLFASYKIGFIGTSIGFMTEKQIEDWRELIWK